MGEGRSYSCKFHLFLARIVDIDVLLPDAFVFFDQSGKFFSWPEELPSLEAKINKSSNLVSIYLINTQYEQKF